MIKLLLIFVCACVAWAADVSGSWNMTAVSPNGQEYKVELELQGEGDKMSGTISSEQGSLPLEEIKLSGNELTYKVSYQGGLLFKLTADGNTMKGTFSGADGTSGKIVATRK